MFWKALFPISWGIDGWYVTNSSQVYLRVASHLSSTVVGHVQHGQLDVSLKVIVLTLKMNLWLGLGSGTYFTVLGSIITMWMLRQIRLKIYVNKRPLVGAVFIFRIGCRSFSASRRYKKQWKKIWTSWTYYLICLINFSCCYVVLFWIKILLILTTERPKVVSSFFKGYSVRYGSDLTVLLYK